MNSNSTVFVSWIGFHGRSDGLARSLGIDAVFFESSGILPIRYLKQWIATVKHLHRTRPSQIIVMQPPVVALLAARCTRVGSRARIVADLHTGAFTDRKWAWALPLVLRLIGKNGAAVVTNESLASKLRNLRTNCFVIHDLIECIPVSRKPGNYVLVPLAYAHDEPLEELLTAARISQDTEWRLTGNAPQWMHTNAPENVTFLGYLPHAEYWEQFEAAGAIAALTSEEDTMQRAAYEALSRGKALITSNTNVLRDYYGDAAIFTEPTAESIADSAAAAIESAASLESSMRAKRDEKLNEQREALDAFRTWLFETEVRT